MKKTIYTEKQRNLLKALIAARKSAGMTQQEVAGQLRKPQSFVAKYELGERRLDVIEFLEITKILGINYQDILKQL